MVFYRVSSRLLPAIFSFYLLSCGPKGRPVEFPVHGSDQVLLGLSREAAEGRLSFSKDKKLEYMFAASPVVLPPASLEIAYSVNAADLQRQPVVEIGGYSWALPAGVGDLGDIIHYAIPVSDTVPQRFAVVFTGGAERNRPAKDAALHIRSVELRERWFGFYRGHDAAGDHWYITPLVSRSGDSAWVIDLGSAAAMPGVPAGFFPFVSVELSPGREAALEAGNRRFEISPRLDRLHIPPLLFTHNGRPLTLSGDRSLSFRIIYADISRFPSPISADPGIILTWPVERWRDSRYEVFRWEHFPSLLIFDMADYAVQDRMLKRLAFFVEKAGFRGRLAADSEIAELHGWNAHDYRAADLARFFQAARASHFPLLAEERELEQILLYAGIIRENSGSVEAGEGGIISISRESDENLRYRFMAHEGFHGLFFIDEDFRAFSRFRWQQLGSEAKRFIFSYFGFQQYDTADEYLMINEFMAHILQQPVSQAGHYFGVLLPSRLEDSPRRKADLPEKDQTTETWPLLAEAFVREAQAFSEYVERRWGLAAGRVSLVTVR